MAKQKKEVPALPIVELYSKFTLPPYEKFFKEFVAINHKATLEEVELAMKEISQTNSLKFVSDIKTLNRGESLKDEDKGRLAETRRVLKEIGYESSDFYNILFKTVQTDFSRHGFVNKICNALTTKREVNASKKHSEEKSIGKHLPIEQKEEMPFYTIKVAIAPQMLAQKLGILPSKVEKILKETNLQLKISEEGVTVTATLPWDRVK